MSKQLTSQRYVFKINSSRLRREKWNLKLTIDEARENQELIALSESQVMRFIDDINNFKTDEAQVQNIKRHIKKLKKYPNQSIVQKSIKLSYQQLDDILFKPDYICVVIDKVKDYHRMNKGFKINGIGYKRLLGTTGGVKKSTIVFVSEKVHGELVKRIANGRDLSKEMIPAKLEAYQALACSASTPVSHPKGILVVDDCVTHFKSDYIMIDDSNTEEPVLKHFSKDDPDAETLELVDSDGYGIGTPKLMEQWGLDIGENYILPGAIIRNSYCKGAVLCVDFHDFAHNDAHTTIVKDVWGHEHNIDDIDLILTTSMLKLWDFYSSIDEYLENCSKHGYTFSITKAAPKELDKERTLNYQFIQDYDLTDMQIAELVKPTIDSIQDILSDDYRKAILYVKGQELNDENVQHFTGDIATALMVEPKMWDDPFVINTIHTMIRKRIDEAKLGTINVKGNFSIVSGDVYSFCQHVFGMEVTGLLKEGEFYSHFWNGLGVDEVVCFRAPMTCHNNIRMLRLKSTNKMKQFYKYMTTITIFNSWDTAAAALNGLDKDGDTVFTTNNSVLLRSTEELPAIMCVQRKAVKKVATEEDMVQANINSFGDEVGSTTNIITSMIDVQAMFPKGSKEYEVLDYRIKCGQLYQQNAIDKTKGIIAKSIPKSWYQRGANKIAEGDSEEVIERKKFNLSIVADKKPYFMNYRYSHAKKAYDDYIKDHDHHARINFGIGLNDILIKAERTSEEETFIQYYYKFLPSGTNGCVVNRVCWSIEKAFDEQLKTPKEKPFDVSILKNDTEYSQKHFKAVDKLYKAYVDECRSYCQKCKLGQVQKEDMAGLKLIMTEKFRKDCSIACPDEKELANIVLDLCYTTKKSKQFAWSICGEVFIETLLEKRDYVLSYPTKDENGDFEFSGEKFSMRTLKIEKEDDENELIA